MLAHVRSNVSWTNVGTNVSQPTLVQTNVERTLKKTKKPLVFKGFLVFFRSKTRIVERTLLDGDTKPALKIHENPRKSMKIHENPRKSMKIYKNPRKSMKIHENPWKSMKIYENLWKLMKIHENLWKSMKIHENPWNLWNSWKAMKIDEKYMKIVSNSWNCSKWSFFFRAWAVHYRL